MEKELRDTSEALEKLRETIKRFTLKGPPSFWTEEAKLKYLYNAVAGFEWAEIPLTKFYSDKPPYSFPQLSTASRTSWFQN